MLLRYFNGLSFADLGNRLNVAENTARMRHERALEKLHAHLSRRGVTSTTAALSLLLANASFATAPAGLAASVSTAILAAIPAATVASAAVITFLMHKLTLPLIATVLTSVLTVTAISQHRKSNQLEATLAALSTDREQQDRKIQEITRLMSEMLDLEKEPTPSISATSVASAEQTAKAASEESLEPGITKKAPEGWHENGSKTDAYVVGVDRVNTLGGMPSAYVKSTQPSVDGFGGMMQTNSAENFRGKRVRMSGWAKTESAVDGGGHLWMRVDGARGAAPFQFDNMNGREVKGTTGWQEYSVVLDVPQEATALAYGFFVQGTGQMWVSGTKIEEVGLNVPSTNMVANQAKSLPKAPTNLSFN
jgi:hypothetical protein